LQLRYIIISGIGQESTGECHGKTDNCGIEPREGNKLFSDSGYLLRELLKALFDPYRPELHYMRGPGPKVARKQYELRRRVFG
jgi:hypothetical protein